jgi:hypothetical protein
MNPSQTYDCREIVGQSGSVPRRLYVRQCVQSRRRSLPDVSRIDSCVTGALGLPGRILGYWIDTIQGASRLSYMLVSKGRQMEQLVLMEDQPGL